MLVMNRLFDNLRAPLRIALLLLLLSMQSFTLAHELDQSIVHDGGVCAVCSVGGNHGGTIVSQQDCPVQKAAFLYAATCPEHWPAEPFRSTPEARAPPSSL
jgi:hypothetical protein